MRKVFLFVALALTALVLFGCGSGGAGNDPIAPALSQGERGMEQPSPQPSPDGRGSRSDLTEAQVRYLVEVVTQTIEVTREVPVTPEIAGVDALAAWVDENVQPCPAVFWRRGRCTATAAEMEAYAAEVSDGQ